jgi:hypothetical protein
MFQVKIGAVMKYLLVVFLMLFGTVAMAQSKFFSTPNRGGVAGAKQNAILTVLQSEQQRMNTCTAAGMVYAPTNPNADAGGCLPRLTIGPDHTSIAAGAGGDNALYVYVDGPSNGHHAALRLIKNESAPTNGGPGVRFDNLDGRLGAIYGSTDGSLGSLHFYVGASGNHNVMQIDTEGVRVDGTIRVGDSTGVCDGSKAGTIRYNSSSRAVEFCNGTVWGDMGGADAVCPAGEALNICRRYRRYSPTSGWSDTGYGCSPIGGNYLVSNIGDDTGWKNQTLEIALRCQ